MSIKAGLHSIAAMALLPAGTLLPVAAFAPQGLQEPKLFFHPIYQPWLGDLMLGSGMVGFPHGLLNLGCGCGSQSPNWCWPGFQGDAMELFLP